MQKQLVPPELLQKADKILFIIPAALGNFIYLQNYVIAFAQQFPHIKIHIFADEVRRTRCFWRWKYLEKYVLYDWLEACPLVEKVYRQTYAPSLFKKSIQAAKQEKYQLVVSLVIEQSHTYARLARSISPRGFIVGMRRATRLFNLVQNWSYRKLNASLASQPFDGLSVGDAHVQWFEHLFGMVVVPERRLPFITIPNKWIVFAKLRFLKWGIDKSSKKFGRVIFINAYAKTVKRSWPLENVATLVRSLKQQDAWGDVAFVVNVVPEEFKRAQKVFNKHSLGNTFLFTADYNFFQLPAVMDLCDLVISVDTSIMHFAQAMHIPVVALMGQKNQGKTCAYDIPVTHVMQALDKIFRTWHIATKESVHEIVVRE